MDSGQTAGARGEPYGPRARSDGAVARGHTGGAAHGGARFAPRTLTPLRETGFTVCDIDHRLV